MAGGSTATHPARTGSRRTTTGRMYAGTAILANATASRTVPQSIAFPTVAAGRRLADRGPPPHAIRSDRVFPARLQVRDVGCASALPIAHRADGLPDDGRGGRPRVRGADVLTIRYQRGSGWHLSGRRLADGAGPLQPRVVGGQPMDDTVNFVSGDRALMRRAVAGRSSRSTQPAHADADGAARTHRLSAVGFGRQLRRARLQFQPRFHDGDLLPRLQDRPPDTAGRLIPSLYRRVDGSATPDELVQGVERLDFLYGVQYATPRSII